MEGVPEIRAATGGYAIRRDPRAMRPMRLVWLTALVCFAPGLLLLAGADLCAGSVRGAQLHTLLEWTGFCAGVLAVSLGLVQTRLTRDFTAATLGFGLLCAGALDAFHALGAAGILGELAHANAAGAWSGALGRPLAAVAVGAGLWLAWRHAGPDRTPSLAFWSGRWGLMLAATYLVAAVVAEWAPRTGEPGRVWEALGATAWLVLAVWVGRTFHPRRPSYFAWGLAVGLGAHALADLMMLAWAPHPFEGAYLAAHFVKMVALLVPVGGLRRDFISTLKHFGQTREVLASELFDARESERQLREREKRYDALFESSSELILSVGQDGRLVYLNQTARQALGGTEHAGQPSETLVHPFHRGQWRQAVEQVLRSRQPSALSSRLVRVDGDPVLVEGTLKYHASAGDPPAVVAQLTDLTERRLAEDSLARFFTLSLDLMCIAGFDGYFKRLNPAWTRATGFRLEELKARPYLDFVHPEDLATMVESTARITTGIDMVGRESRFQTRDGGYRWLMWTAVPVMQERSIYCVARDITELKETQVALSAARSRLEAPPPRPRTERMALVIEPKPETRLALTACLGEFGYDVVTAATLEVGVRLAQGQAPDLVTLDVSMGAGEGWRTLETLRADPLLSRTAVVGLCFDEKQAGGHLLGEVDVVERGDPQRMGRLFEPRPSYLGKRALVLVDDETARAQVSSRLGVAGVAAEAAPSAPEALRALVENPPELLVLDLGRGGLQVLRAARQDERLLAIPVVLVRRPGSDGGAELRALAGATRLEGEAMTDGFRRVLRRILRRSGIARTDSGHWRPTGGSGK